ncbi:hypothetical protein FB45DRAFT_910644 [Roridomyces roridus]|uniref:F-box domain-containing protein n=1 Tax=Roridomyces roridus TaxID=1738132 RepID=A0AAD7BZI5_9AGAR|nr:hypothetical protein FB45DRAFT_910644 [Roridomyces roridus]
MPRLDQTSHTMYSNPQGSRPGVPQATVPSFGRGSPGTAAQSKNALTLGDLYALVTKLEARLKVQAKKIKDQDGRIAVLEQENGELWQEVHRLKGPRLPAEIFFLILESARDDKPALKTFSLVCKSWIPATRRIIFHQILLSAMLKIQPGPILDSPHCTVFPYVQTLNINGSLDDGTEIGVSRAPKWMDNVLVHMPKLTALKSFWLCDLGMLDFDDLSLAIPPWMSSKIRELTINFPHLLTLPQILAFIAKFIGLTRLDCGEIYHWNQYPWNQDAVAHFYSHDLEPSRPPPASVSKLVMLQSGHLPSAILKWFANQHSGIINSFVAHSEHFSTPEFRSFMDKFGRSLSTITMSFSGPDYEAASEYLLVPTHLKSTVLKIRDPKSVFSYLLPTLAQLPTTVEWIAFVMGDLRSTIAASREHEEMWSQLDRTLGEGNFPSLRRVTILCYNGESNDEERTRQVLTGSMARLVNKGVLEIGFRWLAL